MQPADLPGVQRIEHESMIDPWSEEQLLAEMDAVNGVAFVAEKGPQVCGYAFFRTCTPESELLRLAVAGDRRRQGIGGTLLHHALGSFSEQGYATCFLEVRSSNEEALHLYMMAGFHQVGIRKKYYCRPVEDALQLCRDLTDLKGGTP
jgi:ribosomal-protein-alanine N-acetyltransferase